MIADFLPSLKHVFGSVDAETRALEVSAGVQAALASGCPSLRPVQWECTKGGLGKGGLAIWHVFNLHIENVGGHWKLSGRVRCVSANASRTFPSAFRGQRFGQDSVSVKVSVTLPLRMRVPDGNYPETPPAFLGPAKSIKIPESSVESLGRASLLGGDLEAPCFLQLQLVPNRPGGTRQRPGSFFIIFWVTV